MNAIPSRMAGLHRCWNRCEAACANNGNNTSLSHSEIGRSQTEAARDNTTPLPSQLALEWLLSAGDFVQTLSCEQSVQTTSADSLVQRRRIELFLQSS